MSGMRDFMILLIHVIVSRVRLAAPGGLRSVVAESAMVRHQLLILHRGRKRGPNLRGSDRIAAGLLLLFLSPARILRSAIVLKPSTLLHLHNLLRKRKYRLLFSSKCGRRPGPKGPNQELIDAVVARKRCNPSWGCFNPIYAGRKDAQGSSIHRLTLPAHYAFGDNFHPLCG